MNAGVKKIDIGSPAAPKLASSFDTPSETLQIVVLGGLAIVPDS